MRARNLPQPFHKGVASCAKLRKLWKHKAAAASRMSATWAALWKSPVAHIAHAEKVLVSESVGHALFEFSKF